MATSIVQGQDPAVVLTTLKPITRKESEEQRNTPEPKGVLLNEATGNQTQIEDLTDSIAPERKMQDQPGCDVVKGAKAVLVAVAIAGIFAGVVGLLVYLDILQISLTNVGTMSQSLGLYTMLSGFGAAVLTTLLLGVAQCMNCAKETGTKHKSVTDIELTDPKPKTDQLETTVA